MGVAARTVTPMSLGAQMKVIEVALRANVSQYSAGVGLAAAQTKALGNEISGAGKTGKADLNQLGTGAMVMGGAMLAGFGLAAHASMGFEAELSNLAGVSSATGSELDALRQQALDAGKATVFSASEAAQAQTELAKAGVSTADILGGALTGSLNLASAGGLDLARAAEITATSLTMFKLNGNEASHVSDLLAAGANKSAADVDDLAMALSQGGLMAEQAGMSIEDTTGVLALFAQNTLKGSDAGTSLKTMLQRLVPQSNEARQMMDELGLSFYDASGNFIGMSGVAEELKTSLGGLSEEQRNLTLNTIFGTDASRAASILMDSGAAGVDRWTAAVNDSGYAADLAAKKNDNLKGDLEALKGSIETTLIEGGTQANGVLRFLTQATTGLVNGIGSMPGPMAAVAMGFTGITGAGLAAVGMIGTMAPKYREAMSTLEAMGPAGQKAAGGISAVSKAGAAGTIAIAGLTLAWSLWNAELEESKKAGAEVLGGIKTSGVDQASAQIAEIRNQVAGLDNDLANSSNWAVWDADYRAATTDFRNQLVETGNQMMVMVGQAEELAAATGGNADSVYEWLDGQRQAGTVFGSNEEALKAYNAALASGAVEMTNISDETKIADRATQDFKQSIEETFDSIFGIGDAADSVQRAMLGLPEVLAATWGQVTGNTKAALDYRDAMRDVATGAGEVLVEMEKQLGQGPQLQQAARDYINGLIEQQVALGVSRGEAEAYLKPLLQLAGIPALNTTVSLDTTQANAALDALMWKARNTIVASLPFYGPPSGAPGRAGGGLAGAGRAYETVERGPELLQMGSTTMLMMGSRSGSVIPNSDPRTQRVLAGVGAGGGGGSVHYHQHTHTGPIAPNYMGTDRRELIREIREEIRQLERSTAGRD